MATVDTEKGVENATSYTPATNVASDIDSKPLLEKIRDAKKESTSILGFCAALFAILIASVGCSVIMFILTIIPICMIYFGGMHIYDCPINKFIPIYLIITGLVGLIEEIIHLYKYRIRCCRRTSAAANQAVRVDGAMNSKLSSIFLLLRFIWLIFGAVIIYRAFEPNYTDPNDENYCNKITYLIAFWTVTIAMSIGIGAIAVICGLCCIYGFLACRKDKFVQNQ